MMIDEAAARRSLENYSFSDYKQGSATAEYNAEVERVAGKIEEAKAKVSEEGKERLDRLFESFKFKLADWTNRKNRNGAGHVSVMISGPANYNMRAHEKYMKREGKLWEEYGEFGNIDSKIRSIVAGDKVIRSDDKNAVEKIKAKIFTLENSASDRWGYNKAEIRRLKERLLQLAPGEFAEQQANIEVNGAKTRKEIIALWEGGELHKSSYTPDSPEWYFDLFLDFADGKRHYKEWLSLQVDETGELMHRWNSEKRQSEFIPLTEELKYNLMIGKISGSGNKAVIYQHLKSLAEKPVEVESVNESAIINGETAKIVRNKADMKLQLVFEGKPEAATREILKANGFRWAPSVGAWQRLLNGNAEYSLRRIAQSHTDER